ncbi:MAG: hypothetical protein R2757_18050 [Draconibacterium sp.]
MTGISFFTMPMEVMLRGPISLYPLDEELQPGKIFIWTPVGGRSLIKPHFLFQYRNAWRTGNSCGRWLTGKWYVNVMQPDEKSVTLTSGMENEVDSYPGEEIRTPKSILLLLKGDNRMIGHNQFRQFVLASTIRENKNGKFAEHPLSGSFDYGDPAPVVSIIVLLPNMPLHWSIATGDLIFCPNFFGSMLVGTRLRLG